MANPAFETVEPPFTAFRFEVVLDVNKPPASIGNPLCSAAFAECDGLEMSMEPKTFRQGGDNGRQIHRVGPVSYGQVTLRRGMTDNLQLWMWFQAAVQPGKDLTATGEITLWSSDGTPEVTFRLAECLPVRMRGPSLNAKDGQVAIEELQLVYSSLQVVPAGGQGGLGLDVGASASAGFSAGASADFSAGAGASFSAGASAGLSVGGGASISAGASASGDLSFG